MKPTAAVRQQREETGGLPQMTPPEPTRGRKFKETKQPHQESKQPQDPLEYARSILTNITRHPYLQDIRERLNSGFMLAFFTDESMSLLELLTANTGLFFQDCAPLSCDPKHGSTFMLMQLLVPNLFLEGNPMHVGAYFIFIRQHEECFTAMFESISLRLKKQVSPGPSQRSMAT